MQLEATSFSDYEDRIERMRIKVINQPHEICVERAKLITESYQKTRGEPSSLRFAKAMNYFLKNMSIKIWDDEFLVGTRTAKLVGTPLYPEVRIDTIELDLELYDTREVQSFVFSEDNKKLIRDEIIPYWKNEEETVKSRFNSFLTPELNELMLNLIYIVDTHITNGVGHFFPGHPNVLEGGFDGLLSKTKQKMEDFKDDQDKLAFLNTVIIILDGVKHYILRFSDLAKKMASEESDSLRKAELLEISEICYNISHNPPKNFKEAFQLIVFTHIIAGLPTILMTLKRGS
ncbi:MAG: pyruvate formate lyase family protein [Promethearchaeota archaeon]